MKNAAYMWGITGIVVILALILTKNANCLCAFAFPVLVSY